ncbi:MAG: hypothetical protein AAB618_02250 [Patescibacteria group bacterium]
MLHDAYRAHLEALLAQVTSDLEAIAEQNHETGDWEVKPDITEQAEADENTEADAAEELSSQSAVIAELEGSYRNIKLALAKLLDDTYGQCEICNGEISAARLEILPSARTCTLHLDQERSLPL